MMTVNFLFAQNQYWENIEGLYGGVIFSMIVSGNNIYCAGNGGVYKSTNNGENWVSLGLKEKSIWKICIASDYIFAISNSGCFRKYLADTTWINVKQGRWQSIYAKDSTIFIGSEYDGVFRSTDLGLTWIEKNNGIDNRDIEEIFITSNNIVLASAAGTSGSGVFRSTNNGDNWERIDPYQFAWNFEGIAEYDSILYAFDFTNSAKVYKSTDFGLTWFLPINASAPSDIIQTIYVDETGIYVGVYHYGIFKSTNEGISWTNINSGLNNKNVFDINCNATNLFCATYDGIYKSSKSNLSWIKKSEGINNIWITSLATKSDQLLIGTYGSGLFTYENKKFQRRNIGTDLMFIIDLKVYNNNQIYVISSSWAPTLDAKFHYSSDNGNSWVLVNNGFDTGGLQCLDVNHKYIYAGSWYGLFRKQINGNYWEKLTNGIPNNVNISSIASSDSVVIVTNGTSEIYRSTDYGDSWQPIYVQNLFSGIRVYSENKGEFYLGSGQVNKLFKSSNYGITWQNLNIPLFSSNIQSIYVNKNELFVGLSNDGILISSDNGINWVTSNVGLDSKNISSFSTLENTIYVGTRFNGIYKRILDLTEPIPIDTIQNTNEISFKWTSSMGINKYRFQLSEDSLFANLIEDNQNIFDTSYTPTILDYNKVYYWRVSSITKYWNDHFTEIQRVEIGSPTHFQIYQNYPNPFNNQTTLKFEVPKLSWVELELFDILGRRVKTLLSEQKAPGSYKFHLTNDNLASGVYIIKFKSDNFFQSIKIVLLK